MWIEAVSPNFPVAFEFAAMHSQQQQEQKIHNGMSLCTRRMAKTKKSDTTQVWRRCGEIGSLLCCWWECEMVPLLWRTFWLFLKKQKKMQQLSLSIYRREMKTWSQMFIAAGISPDVLQQGNG